MPLKASAIVLSRLSGASDRSSARYINYGPGLLQAGAFLLDTGRESVTPYIRRTGLQNLTHSIVYSCPFHGVTSSRRFPVPRVPVQARWHGRWGCEIGIGQMLLEPFSQWLGRPLVP
jgi:hypothetical protein